MEEKDIIKRVMEESGYTWRMLAEDLGYKHASNLVSMLDRSKTMTVASFVRILDAMGCEVIVRGRGMEVGVDSVPVEHGKYRFKEKVEAEKIFEKQKEPNYRMINGRRVVEVSKGVWRYE